MDSLKKKISDFLPVFSPKFAHGWTDGVTVEPVAFLRTIGLTQSGRDYQFQGKMRDILEFMTGEESELTVRCHSKKRAKLVIDIYDVALKPVQQYQKAIVEQLTGISLLLKFIEEVGDKQVVMKLRHGETAPPATSSHIRLIVKPTTSKPMPFTLGDLAVTIAEGVKNKTEWKEGATNVLDVVINIADHAANMMSVDIGDVEPSNSYGRGYSSNGGSNQTGIPHYALDDRSATTKERIEALEGTMVDMVTVLSNIEQSMEEHVIRTRERKRNFLQAKIELRRRAQDNNSGVPRVAPSGTPGDRPSRDPKTGEELRWS